MFYIVNIYFTDIPNRIYIEQIANSDDSCYNNWQVSVDPKSLQVNRQIHAPGLDKAVQAEQTWV
jgi:hypothetical protein